MNIFSNDKISVFRSTHHRMNKLWECRTCRFQTNTQANFLIHRSGKLCTAYHGTWFQICVKKKKMKNYYHIRHRYIFDKVLDDIRNRK
jgi:hypothetical protein